MLGLGKRHKHDAVDVPHLPFYKDERVLGKTVTVSVSLRLFLAAVIVVVLAFGWALFKLIDANNQMHAYLNQAHARRITEQRRTDAEIDQLACYIIANIPNTEAPIVPKVRAQYGCPPYGKDPNFRLYKPNPKTRSKRVQHGSRPSPRPDAAAASSGPSATSTSQFRAANAPATGRTRPTTPPVTGSGGSPVASLPGQPGTTSPPVVPLPVKLPPVISSGPIGAGGSACSVRVGNVCLVR